MQNPCIRIHQDDVVAVALEPLSEGSQVLGVTLLENIPQGHKFALKNLEPGDRIIKYGYAIGEASCPIKAGQHVHVHNTHTLLSESAEYKYDAEGAKKAAEDWREKNPLPATVPSVKAYRRKNGTVGIRNEIWIVPTVGCVNRIAENLASWANGKFLGGEPKPNQVGGLEGVFAWTHPYGCSQMGDDHAQTRTVLADLVKHPNAGGVLVLALGCENVTMAQFKEALGQWDDERVKFLTAQESSDEIAEGRELLSQLAEVVSKDRRESVPASELVIGMKCGGSDGLSGITANALVGRVCDTMASLDASVILTEVPEMFGAEQMLMDRCKDREMFDRTVTLINNFKDYFTRHGQVVYENPSPGNKAGGITTLEDKSLGCVQKGGKAPVCGVLNYGQRMAEVGQHGLNLLEGPGNDIVSTTAMTAAGAHMILFTTGRGTPLGAPVPTIKIATNHPLAEKKSGWIDFDASYTLENGFEEERDKLLAMIYDIASGKIQTRNETNGYREIAIFKEGVTL